MTTASATKLKDGVYIATTSATATLCDNFDAPCYTIVMTRPGIMAKIYSTR